MKGFLHNPDADPDQYLFGSGQLLGEALQPDRNWLPWCPEAEIQIYPWGDTLACGWFNTLNCLEILIKRQYGLERNYSERAGAKYTNTDERGGSDPHEDAEVIRRTGIPFETRWPSLKDIASFSAYYAALPGYVIDAFKDFHDEFELKHDTVRGLDAMWDALQYSPLGCSVGWNTVDENGYWFKQGNGEDSHWSGIVGGEYGKYWLFSDSAQPILKRVRWDLAPKLVKRYSITKRLTTDQLSWLSWAAQQLRNINWAALAAVLRPAPVPPPVVEVQPVEAPLPIDPPPTLPHTDDLRIRLYNAAFACIGKDASPADRANDEVACAESVNEIYKSVFGEYIAGGTLSTATMYQAMRHSQDFLEVFDPLPGDIIISPTNYGNPGAIGHVGIVGKNHIMSNTSATGKWEPNYTLVSWRAYFAVKHGFPVYFIRRQ